MKLSISRVELNTALKAITPTVSPKSTLAILSCVLLEAADDKLTLSATDLDLFLTITLPADISAPGTAAVPATIIGKWVNGVSGETVKLESKDNDKLLVICERQRITISGYGPDDFPESNVDDVDELIEMPTETFIKMVRHAYSSTNVSDHSRPFCMGIYVMGKNGVLTMVGLDGYMLSIAETPLDAEMMALPHANTMMKVTKVITDEITSLVVVGTKLIIKSGNVLATCSLIDAKYPDYATLVPTQFISSITLKAKDLLNVMSLLDPLARDVSGRVTMTPADGGVSVTTISSQAGSAESFIEAIIDGDFTKASYSNERLAAGVKEMESDDIIIHFGKRGFDVIEEVPTNGYRFVIGQMVELNR